MINRGKQSRERLQPHHAGTYIERRISSVRIWENKFKFRVIQTPGQSSIGWRKEAAVENIEMMVYSEGIYGCGATIRIHLSR